MKGPKRQNYSPSPAALKAGGALGNVRLVEKMGSTIKPMHGDSFFGAGAHGANLDRAQGHLPSNSSIYKAQFRGSRQSGSLSKGSRLGSARSGGSNLSATSAVQSELARRLHRHDNNSRKMLLLDQNHMRALRDPDNVRNASLFIPEGLSPNPARDLEAFSISAAKKALPRDLENPMRSNSAQLTMRQGLRYKFKLADLNKYSSRLKHKDLDWKLKLSALGKQVPDMNTRKKILMKGSHFNTLLRLLRQTDWSRTPIFHQFQRNGRWKHEDDQIFSDVELKYNISYLNKYINVDIDPEEEIDPKELKKLVSRYFDKTMHTLEVLMNQLNMMYYLEKIRLMFADQDPTVAQLQKLMARCLKLYAKIDQFIKIFNLIKKKEVSVIRIYLS